MARSTDNGVYGRLGGSWWDETSLLNVLHGSVTPGRFAYFRDVLARQFGAGAAGLRVLDIGCGGVFLAEEFAALGCRVTGVRWPSRSEHFGRSVLPGLLGARWGSPCRTGAL